MTILYFGAVDWYFLRQRPQQLARGLSLLGHDVIYTFPRSLVGTWRRHGSLPAGALAAWRDGVEAGLDRLHLYEPCLPGRLRGSVVRFLNRELFQRGLKARLSRAGFKPDWLWFGHPSQSEYAALFPDVPALYDCMDEWRHFRDSEGVARLERDLLARSRVVLTSSRQIHERVAPLHASVHLVPNGVEHAHFRRALDLRSAARRERRPRAVVMGTLGSWLDLPLLSEVASRLDGWDFDLIGPWGEDVPETSRPRRANVRELGKQDYAKLPALLARADVAFMVFKVDSLTRGVDPVKAYEFLAAGLPIVTTRLPELDKFREGVLFGDDAAGLARAFKEALSRYGAEPARQVLSDSVRGEDWGDRAARVEALLRSSSA